MKGNAEATATPRSIRKLLPKTVYEPVFVTADHIVSIFFAGLTSLKMTTEERIEVQEIPEEITVIVNAKVPKKRI